MSLFAIKDICKVDDDFVNAYNSLISLLGMVANYRELNRVGNCYKVGNVVSPRAGKNYLLS